MSNHKTSGNSFFGRAIREPLVHFLLLAAGLFVIQFMLGSDEREVITVDQATRTYLVERAEELQLEPLTDEARATIVETFVEEEILIREARARGYDDSTRVRELLLQNMRFFMISDVDEATDEQLRAYFDSNRDRFVGPTTYSITSVQFNELTEITEEIVAQLADGIDPNKVATRPVPFGVGSVRSSQREIVAAFGRDKAREILGQTPGDAWLGPYELRDGSGAMLRLEAVIDPETPDFDTVKNWVSADWVNEETRRITDAEIAKIASKYRIEISEE